MRTFIIGGTRGIGAYLAAAFGARGDEITATGRNSLFLFERVNYLIFAQRYRGSDVGAELDTSIALIHRVINATEWAQGDKGIVILSSPLGQQIGKRQGFGYHVAKAGMEQAGRYFAAQLPIRVNTVAFNPLKLSEPHSLEPWYAENVPLGRMGVPADVANVVLFLCSPAAAYVSGQRISVDGGLGVLLLGGE